jgi:hypothetical protein
LCAACWRAHNDFSSPPPRGTASAFRIHLNTVFTARTLQALLIAATMSSAQELVPRAYLVTPKGSNAVTLSWSWNSGEVTFDPSVPISDNKGSFQTQVLSYYHSYGLFGRSSNIVVSLPYTVANFQGMVAGNYTEVYRSGMVDARVRFSINLSGGPAMRLSDFVKWREKRLIGASVSVVIPTGQNDPARVINPGTNRWAVKPEVGVTRRWGRWVGEVYGGVWLFGGNPHFYPGDSKRTQRPMEAIESHLGYYVKPRLWASLDANFWAGGRSTINSVEKEDTQKASRLGVTMSVPVRRRQSLKFSFSRGAYVSIGGSYQTVSAAWQYSWLGKPR